MIEIEKPEIQSYEEILSLAKKQIAQMSNEWTNQQEYDPGITLIELFAWLKTSQDKHINNISPMSKIVFLDLLGVKRKRNKPSRTLIFPQGIKQEVFIPAATQWIAGNDLIFENIETQYISDAEITSVEFFDGSTKSQINYFDFNNRRVFNLFGENKEDNSTLSGNYFIIKFDKPIKKDRDINLYFDVFLEENINRNPINKTDEFFPMAKVLWEFYGELNGEIGWHKVNINRDGTYDFLFSGTVSFNIDGSMQLIDDSYSIRVRVLEESYDLAPRIKTIKMNVFEVFQQETLCDKIVIKKKDISSENIFEIYHNLVVYGDHEVYYRKNGSFALLNDIECQKDYSIGLAKFDLSKYCDDLSSCSEDEDTFIIVFYNKNLKNKNILGSSNAMSLQVIPCGHEDIYYKKFNLIVGYKNNGKELFDEWQKVETFISSNKYDKHYILNIGSNKVFFGDHISGKIPPKGKDNIKFSSLVLTKGKDSNIKSGMINRVKSENPLIKSINITQITNASGGRNSERIVDMEKRALKLFESGESAVTINDYEKIVKKTPGLIIDKIKILPSYSPKNMEDPSRCVSIVIKSYSNSKPMLLNSYEKNIKRYLERFRLINTNIIVVPNSYVRLNISGEIVVNSYYKNNDDLIKKYIQKYIERLNQSYGQTLYFGDLFGMINKLDCVSYVKDLKVNPSGGYIEKTKSSDIIINPNGMYLIEGLNFIYTKSSNI